MIENLGGLRGWAASERLLRASERLISPNWLPEGEENPLRILIWTKKTRSNLDWANLVSFLTHKWAKNGKFDPQKLRVEFLKFLTKILLKNL